MDRSMSFRGIILAAVILLCFVCKADPSDYVIGPGDVIRIDAYEAEKISGKFPVDSRGYINHFILGKIRVGGKTLSQINNELEKMLGKGFLKDPKVNVVVEEYHSQEVFVLGEVAKPGPYGLKGENLLLDVLLQAGGPTGSAGDVVSILRRSPQVGEEITTTGIPLTHLTVNVTRLLLDGDLAQNIPVQKGDVIFLPRSDKEAKTFFIVGQVKTPGAYKLKDQYTVLNAILDAGGFTKYAKGNGTKLIRGKSGKQDVFVLEMEDVLEDGDRDKDMALEDGDLIVVPSGLF